MLVLFNHVVFAQIKILLKGIELLLIDHFCLAFANGLHLSYLIVVFTCASYLILHTKDKCGLLSHQSLAMFDDFKHL